MANYSLNLVKRHEIVWEMKNVWAQDGDAYALLPAYSFTEQENTEIPQKMASRPKLTLMIEKTFEYLALVRS